MQHAINRYRANHIGANFGRENDLPGDPVSAEGDIFMLGLFIYRVITGRDALQNYEIERRVKPDLSAVENYCVAGKFLAHLLSFMLSHDKRERPRIEDVLYHPFFRSWEENRTSVDTLYNILHNAGVPSYNDEFEFAVTILRQWEKGCNWSLCLDRIPPTLRDGDYGITGSRKPPSALKPDGTLSEHPLPNLDLCIQWIRHFYHHIAQRPFSACKDALEDSTREVQHGKGSILGFLYRHESVYWFLPGLWEVRVKCLRLVEQRRCQLKNEFEERKKKFEEEKKKFDEIKRIFDGACEEYDSCTSALNSDELKVKAIVGQRNS